MQGFAAGALFFLILIEWIRPLRYHGLIAASLVLAAYVALFALLVRLLAPRADRLEGAPGARVRLDSSAEWARGLGTFGFTWGGLAYSQHGNLPLLQLASVTGPYGITFLIAAVNAGLASMIGVAWSSKPLAGREGVSLTLRRPARHARPPWGGGGGCGSLRGLGILPTAPGCGCGPKGAGRGASGRPGLGGRPLAARHRRDAGEQRSSPAPDGGSGAPGGPRS